MADLADKVSIEDRFLFDIQGFLLLREVLTQDECRVFLDIIERLKERDYDESWMERMPPDSNPLPTYDCRIANHVRFNGLPRLDNVFDSLIDHESILPYLRAFITEPQLINTWAIEKKGQAETGVWHRGMTPTEYSYRNGKIRTRMLNVIFFLTDNGVDDGCITAIPGAHKSNFDLDWQRYSGLELPGSVAVTGKAGDVFLFSETVIHNGLAKTSDSTRTNLYYNYVAQDFGATGDAQNLRHYCLPPSVRARFTPQQKAVTHWMEFMKDQE